MRCLAAADRAEPSAANVFTLAVVAFKCSLNRVGMSGWAKNIVLESDSHFPDVVQETDEVN